MKRQFSHPRVFVLIGLAHNCIILAYRINAAQDKYFQAKACKSPRELPFTLYSELLNLSITFLQKNVTVVRARVWMAVRPLRVTGRRVRDSRRISHDD